MNSLQSLGSLPKDGHLTRLVLFQVENTREVYMQHDSKENTKIINAKSRANRQAWIIKDRLENPEKYKEYNKKHYLTGEKKDRRSKSRAKKYGLTLEQYKQMMIDCENKCSICLKEETRKSGKSDKVTRLSIDHCHKTNKVRHLLCHNCNIMIGAANESIDILQKAIAYLRRHSG